MNNKKGLHRRFKETSKRNPCWSSHTSFAVAVIEGQYPERHIRQWFAKLVDKNDYEKADRFQVLKHLLSLSDGSRAGGKEVI